MTQLNKLDAKEATQAVAQANTPTDYHSDDIVRAYDFLEAACIIARKAEVPIRYATIMADEHRITLALGTDIYPNCYFFQADIFDTSERYYDAELDNIEKFCSEEKGREARSIRVEIAGLQEKLAKLEGRV